MTDLVSIIGEGARMRRQRAWRTAVVGLISVLSVTACAASSQGSQAQAPTPSDSPPAAVATLSPSPTAPIPHEVRLGAGLPSLQPASAVGATSWQVVGNDAVTGFLQSQQELLSAGSNFATIVPIAASPQLVGFRLRVWAADTPRTSRTFWLQLPSGLLLDNADLLSSPGGGVAADSLGFTDAGDLYWETPQVSGWGPQSATAQGRLSPQGMVARAAALAPLDPRAITPTDCSAVKCVALTFDDGPGPGTTGLLHTLASNGARATFFVNGINVPGNEDLLWAMVGAGNELGNHNQTHVRLSPLPDAEVAAGVAETDALISPMRSNPLLFRPPYGDFDSAVRDIVAAAGYSIVMWNLDPLDYRTTDSDLIARRVLASVRPGSVVLSHDTLPSTEVAYRTIIPALKERGYHLVTVDELLGPGSAGQVRGGY